MEGSRFDQIIRQTGGNRRAIVGTLLAAAAAPLSRLATAGAKSRRERRRRRHKKKKKQPTDKGLQLLEQLAEEMEQVTGDCDALAAAASAFQQEHGEELQSLLEQAAAWTPEEREQRTKANRERIVAAAQSLYAQIASCNFRGEVASPICEEGGQSDLPAPGNTTCHGCDCQCICPLSSGECAAQCTSCFVTGDHGVCCWCGTCMDHNCSSQCPNCCKL